MSPCPQYIEQKVSVKLSYISLVSQLPNFSSSSLERWWKTLLLTMTSFASDNQL